MPIKLICNTLEFLTHAACKKAARDLKEQGYLLSEYHSGSLHQLTFLNANDAHNAFYTLVPEAVGSDTP